MLCLSFLPLLLTGKNSWSQPPGEFLIINFLLPTTGSGYRVQFSQYALVWWVAPVWPCLSQHRVSGVTFADDGISPPFSCRHNQRNLMGIIAAATYYPLGQILCQEFSLCCLLWSIKPQYKISFDILPGG